MNKSEENKEKISTEKDLVNNTAEEIEKVFDYRKILETIQEKKEIEPEQLYVLLTLLLMKPYLFKEFGLYTKTDFLKVGESGKKIITKIYDEYIKKLKLNELTTKEDFDAIYEYVRNDLRISDQGFLYYHEILQKIAEAIDEQYNKTILNKTEQSRLSVNEYELVSPYGEKALSEIHEYDFTNKEAREENLQTYNGFYHAIKQEANEQGAKLPHDVKYLLESQAVFGLKFFEEILKMSHLFDKIQGLRRYAIQRYLEEQSFTENEKKEIVFLFPEYKEIFELIGFPSEGKLPVIQNHTIKKLERIVDQIGNKETTQNIILKKISEIISQMIREFKEMLLPLPQDQARIDDMEKERPGRWEKTGKNLITFYPNAIEVNGIKFSRENMKATPNNVDIFQGYDGGEAFPDEYYFTWYAAMEVAKKQGKKLAKKEQREKAMEFFPNYKKNKRCKAGKYLTGLLGLKLSGYRYSSGSRNNVSEYGFCRSGSEGDTGAWNFGFGADKGKLNRDIRGCSFPVRPVED